MLVGVFDANQAPYLDRLNDMILQLGLDGRVLLTGLAPDAELQGWYARADLYVSLSRHEGFGVPLIEAMAHAIPVLAWPSGAVPYTLGGGAGLLVDRDPAVVAGHMLALAKDPARRAALAAQQAGSLDRFALHRHLPFLQEALGLAGAQPPPGADAHRALAANLRVAIAGHVAKTYSLARVNRAMAAAFEQQRPGAVRLIPIEGAPTGDFSEVPPECLDAVTALAGRAAPITGPEMVISQHYPVFVPPQRGDLTVAMMFWEETLVPSATVQTLNDGFDAVLAPSRAVAKALVDSGVTRPVLNVGQPLPAVAPASDRPHAGPFTFLHVSSAFPRKGIDVLLAAWRQAFRAGDPVRLVIKTFPNPHNDAAAQIERLRAEDPAAAPITLIDRDLDEAAHGDLLADADAMVLPTRGEGYNLVAAEAMAAGLPLIVTDRGGHRDFCGPGTARLICSRLLPSGSHLATPHSLWAEPDRDDLAAALQASVGADLTAQTKAAHAAIAAAADPAAFVNRVAAAAATLMLTPAAAPLRIAWVTTWAVRCGIAAYAHALLEAMPTEGVGRLAILCDDRTEADGDRIRPCWRIDTPDGGALLADTVRSEDPDIVLVQHQSWLLGWGKLAALLTTLTGDGRAVMVTLHNTQNLLDVPEAERQAAVAALGGVARVLVHTRTDLDRLATFGLVDQVTLLPFGVSAPPDAIPACALPPESAPLIGCYGFFLPGKGIGALIEAVAALRARWPGIRLRLVNAQYDDPSSAREIAACRAIAEAAGLAVDWHLDFLPAADSLALLQDCDVIALPYQPSKEAASSALRTALTARVPVAVTPIALFEEAADAVARLPGHDPASLAAGLAALLADDAARNALNERAGAWLARHDIAAVAGRLHGMMRGLAAQRRVGAPLDGSLWPL